MTVKNLRHGPRLAVTGKIQHYIPIRFVSWPRALILIHLEVVSGFDKLDVWTS